MNGNLSPFIAHQGPIQEHWLSPDMATQEVVAFERRFGTKHLLLACHTALPFIFTPKMLNLIHLNFLDHEYISWFAEADFLLSPLCRQVDNTLFEMEPRVREVLLTTLEERFFGHTRLIDIADFLLMYLEKQQDLREHNATATTLRWIALSYCSPDQAITEMTSLLQESLSAQHPRASDLQSQLLVTTTLEIVAKPLEHTSLQQEYRTLICDSRILAELLYNGEGNPQSGLIQQNVVRKYGEHALTLLSPAMRQRLFSNSETAISQNDRVNQPQMKRTTQFLSNQHNDQVSVPSDEIILSDKNYRQRPAMNGNLQAVGLQFPLKMLAWTKKTGKLQVTSGLETLSISLRKGQIVGLHEEGVSQPDLLGMLCLLDRLAPVRAQTIREQTQGNMQIALIMLVERGWMSAGEMQQRLEFSVIQSISHALHWVNGHFAFYSQSVSTENKMQPLDVDSVLLEALHQADEWKEITAEGVIHLTRATVGRWVSRDMHSLGLSRKSIQVLCLSNGDITLREISLVLMMSEARVARLMAYLLEQNLIELVDTALETELQQDLSNIIIKYQHTWAQQCHSSNPKERLPGLITTLSECINELLLHHSRYARSLRGRSHISQAEIVHYLERQFVEPLQLLARQRYNVLETASFVGGSLNCSKILSLNITVKGRQLEEYYQEAVQGLAAFLRVVFGALLRDEVGNSHTGRQLSVAWKVFLSEIEHELQQYQVYRTYLDRHPPTS